MLLRTHPVMAEEDTAAGGGGGEAAPEPEAAPAPVEDGAPEASVSEPAPEPPAMETAGEPAAEAAPELVAEPPAPEPEEAKAEEPPVESREVVLERELAAARDRAATLEREILDQRFAEQFDKAGVPEAMREFARFKLGAVDPRTDEGKAAIDAWKAQTVDNLKRAGFVTQAPETPTEAQLEAQRRHAAKGTAWEFLTPEFLDQMG